MPTPALLLTIATLLPLGAFSLLLFTGKKLGNPLAGWVGTAFIAGSFLCSIAAMISWYGHGTYNGVEWGFEKSPILLPFKWIPVGAGTYQTNPGFLDIGVYVDSLTICMFAMITLVATLVHLFSIGYMHEDVRFPRFFTYLGLFCFSMLGLVIGGTVLQLFIFWELVGLCSYLLIGFWYEKKSASNAAIKAFVVNRVGDFGFLIGFGILFYHLGNVSLPAMWNALGGAGTVVSGGTLSLPSGVVMTSAMVTAMGIGLFFGAVGKSAQFPLHVWLPDAMEGPTPVSALIHAATMVAAGVYLVGRIFPILSPDAKLFIAIIGCTTLTMAALIAVAQTDIKKVLAYSTLSQLGYMILAIGIGSYIGGLFHLITHAFFKALLFLGSGSVIHAAHHEQELPQYGGLMRKIPVTAVTFGIAVLAIAGTPFLSGYYSKDLILAHAGAFGALAEHSGRSHAYWLLFICPAVIAFVTPFYMTRCWMLTFWGKPRNQHLYDHAREIPILWAPLAVLAVMAVVAGYPRFLGAPELIKASIGEATTIAKAVDPKHDFSGFATAWPEIAPESAAEAKAEGEPVPGEHAVPHPKKAEAAADVHGEDPLHHGHELVEKWISWAFVVGIGLGVVIYLNGYWVAGPLTTRGPLALVRIWLYRRMYFDELYFAIFVNSVVGGNGLAGGVVFATIGAGIGVFAGIAAGGASGMIWLGLLVGVAAVVIGSVIGGGIGAFGFSGFSAIFDSYVVDGLVNLAGWTVKQASFIAGANDKYVVDGAVNGVAAITQDLGAAVRAPQTGRIRMYVTVLMAAVAIGVAVAIIVALS